MKFILKIFFFNFEVEIDNIMNSYLQNDYIHSIYNELNKSDNAEWSNLGIKSTLQFAFQIFISNLNYFMIENGMLKIIF